MLLRLRDSDPSSSLRPFVWVLVDPSGCLGPFLWIVVAAVLFGSEVGGLIDKLEANRHEPEG
jgi:hypothetical protein